MPAGASGAAAHGDAPSQGGRLSELSVSFVCHNTGRPMVALWGRRGFRIGSSDREVDHGEEVQSEEEIGQEKEGRSGQKEEDTEGVEEEDSEEGRKEAGQEGEEGSEQAAQGRASAEARTRSDARTGARAGLGSDEHGTERR